MSSMLKRANWTGIWIAIIVLLIGLSGEVLAKNIRVPNDHSTVQAALDAAAKGDTVKVAQGTFKENIKLKSGVILQGGWDKSFSKRNIRGNETILDGSKNAGYVVLGADGATIDGFTIMNGSRKELSDNTTIGSGLYLRNTSPTIINNLIK